jgi:galactitol-specific phosphotransferase system IIB component
MKNNKPLTEKQFDIQLKAKRDTDAADKWLRENGINVQTMSHTHVKLVQAQHDAHHLLTTYAHILTESQIAKLHSFQRKMNTGHIRKKMKPDAAYVVFNISTKIVRKLHKQQQAQ